MMGVLFLFVLWTVCFVHITQSIQLSRPSFLSSIGSITHLKPYNNDGIDPELEKFYFPKEIILQPNKRISSHRNNIIPNDNKASDAQLSKKQAQQVDKRQLQDSRPVWMQQFPKIHLRLDPVINFKLKQQLTLLGASITLGMDYLTDIAHWRSYCQIEDAWLRGRFSLRGSELGWAKTWPVQLGLGEQNTALFKLRMGLNLKTHRLYAKLRFRTDPVSPFDLGDGLSCAGKLPLPMSLLPSMTRGLPLRVEYRVRINTRKGSVSSAALKSQSSSNNIHQSRHQHNPSVRNKYVPYKMVTMSTGLGGVEVSLDELNFCLEWDENSPVWGIGLVRTDPARKKLPIRRSNHPEKSSVVSPGSVSPSFMRGR